MRMLMLRVLQIIDRDVARWSGTPLGTAGVAFIPMICWSVLTGDRPAEAPALTLVALLILPVLLGMIGIWRGWLYLWSEHQRLQALGTAEEKEQQRRR